MTNKQKIKELKEQVKCLEKAVENLRDWFVQHTDIPSMIEEIQINNVSGLSKEQVQDLMYKLSLLAYKADNRKGNISFCVAEIIKMISDMASEQNEQTESE